MLNANESVAFVQGLIFSFFAFWLISKAFSMILDMTTSSNSIVRVSNWNEMTLKVMTVVILSFSGLGAYLIYSNGLHQWYGLMACFISLGYVLVSPLLKRLKNI